MSRRRRSPTPAPHDSESRSSAAEMCEEKELSLSPSPSPSLSLPWLDLAGWAGLAGRTGEGGWANWLGLPCWLGWLARLAGLAGWLAGWLAWRGLRASRVAGARRAASHRIAPRGVAHRSGTAPQWDRAAVGPRAPQECPWRLRYITKKAMDAMENPPERVEEYSDDAQVKECLKQTKEIAHNRNP